MSLDDYGNVIPLIICGTGRSGTRQLADILDIFPDVAVHGELQRNVQGALLTLMHAKNTAAKRRGRDWKCKRRFVFECWEMLTEQPSGKYKNQKVIGTKSPGNEHLFDKYESFFEGESRKPIYIYCARNVEDTWASFKTMPWNTFQTVVEFSDAYAASYAQLEAMTIAAPDRVVIFNLDAYIASDKNEYVRALCSDIGLAIPDSLNFSDVANRNSSSAAFGKKPKELSAEDREYLKGRLDICQIQERYFTSLFKR